ncbi:nuclear transport factor 2 family protein [Mycolicibacterium smegmatis]|uniref:nuclear transport factor 2 family protein n=1 Tax=Mycolicibacterium smegmatis TaxID=1772 RepID=UPI001CBFE38B|nr:nuclear transport factor 2 family protein [Mycolicibacterium smegmatis]MDF1898646.1 nuclear transport factor 2 family protein [Mycolicibacterium smegmatis]MDF1907867.1 nuclear transport factor 2 family protein [Mycolicibacterium smegmatis]MDF1917257.1 nuclear transport factor 2 family protein [Mycolicibacterium smegmatis]MDF1924797.1 nuclear transport factor 2 family protein [Mycolicibacterium smegmatis]UGT76890.1 nuclear transport factor 2 family protein [Mycolicibacterium smegmatis]
MTTRPWRAGARYMTWMIAAVATMMAVGCSGNGNAEKPDRTGRQQRNAEVVRDAFARGVGDQNSFYSILTDDVEWTVARAGRETTYSGREEFLRDGAGPILARLDGPIQADVRDLVTEGDKLVAFWRGTATARDGQPYVNDYVWAMTLRDERVARVTAYLDFVVLDELLTRVTPADGATAHSAAARG